jgi:hypothetical protein
MQLHNATIPDEAWHVKRITSEGERIEELQRYVTRVVQYLSYCISGQQADQLLARIKGCKFADLLRRYSECLEVVKWTEHSPFLEGQLIEALICIFAQAGNHPIMEQCMKIFECFFDCRPVCVMRGFHILGFAPLRQSSLPMRMLDSQPPNTAGVG